LHRNTKISEYADLLKEAIAAGDATRRVPPGMRPRKHEIPRSCRLVNNLREELPSLVGCCSRLCKLRASSSIASNPAALRVWYRSDWPCRNRLAQGAIGFNKQIFGSDEQVSGHGPSDKEGFGPTRECRVGRAELITSPALLNLPRPLMVGAFSSPTCK